MSETFVQGSSEWHTSRLGRVTASRVADVIAKTKSSGWGASRMNYMAELIAERLTGIVAPSYINAAMAWGNECEPQARAAYEFRANVTVTEVGFVNHPEIQMTGASPDGLVGNDGLVEIKCPTTKTHIDTLLDRAVPKEYVTQMQWQLACTKRAWCDYVSFDPRLPAAMQLFTARIMRDDKHIAELEKAVFEFLAEVTLRVHELTEIYGGNNSGGRMTAYRYRDPIKRRAYVRERMQMYRIWRIHKNRDAVFFREWATLFVQMVVAL